MTAERIKGQLTFMCDNPSCGEYFEPSTNDFREGWSEAKSEGWTTHTLAEREWYHRCPDCPIKTTKPNITKLMGGSDA